MYAQNDKCDIQCRKNEIQAEKQQHKRNFDNRLIGNQIERSKENPDKRGNEQPRNAVDQKAEFKRLFRFLALNRQHKDPIAKTPNGNRYKREKRSQIYTYVCDADNTYDCHHNGYDDNAPIKNAKAVKGDISLGVKKDEIPCFVLHGVAPLMGVVVGRIFFMIFSR